MRNLDLGQLRKEFLDYFEKQNHLVLKSFPLIPIDDDSLLLINAGMAPLKKYFTGEKKLSKDRVCSSQRCIRTPDIDEVGKTQRHATFFEMLGNFSFGDYFKEEAIQWAWDFLTNVIEIPVDRLWVSVYYEDTEAYNIWKDKIGVSPARIVKLGKEDNFWELEQGPCGPCSEIYVDRGYELDPRDDIKAGDDTERFVEVWNLVFTQFNKDEHGNYHRLKHPNIDTGMGLERLAMVVQNADNIFEIRLMKSIIEEIEKVSGKKYKTNEKDDISIRIISDHSRAMTFLVNDGVIPSNEGRGYVLRRLIRRAARHGKLLGIEDRFLERIVKQVIAIYKEGYPELKESEERILKIVRAEEEKFHETLALGLDILEEMIASTKDVFRGEDAFKLYDTYGFPLELTKEILDEKNITLDEDGFVSLMNEQKEKSRAGHKENMIGWTGKDMSYLKSLSKTSFDGYDCLEEEVEVIKIFFDNTEVSSLRSNEKGIIILDRTPFYAEGGGQVGDVGVLESDTASAKVETTTKTSSEAFLHHVEVIQGEISVGDHFTARVNEMTRRDTMKNHSATHLLDQALKDVLGNHIAQAGSYVDNHRLRFDITHFEAISKEDLRQVEAIVNEKIAMGLSVTATNMSLEESAKLGAIGLFEDKYKDVVRVVQMGNYSKELCGGTHVSTTSDIQMFKILSESSVAAGVRRIEAITGRAVYSYLLEKENFITDVMRELRVVHPEDVTKRILQQKEENKKLALDIQKLMREGSSNHVDEILKNGEDIDGIFVVTHKFEDMDSSLLRDMADQLKDRKKNSVVVLANVVKDKISFVASVSDEAIAQNIFAGNLVKFVAQMAGGNGGGKKNFAQAGGKDVSKVDNALKSVLKFVKEEKGGK